MRQCEELRTKKEAREKGRKEKSSEGAGVDHGPRGPQHEVQRRGGCRPGFNVQFATDTATGIVLGVDVTNAGTDSEQMPPMLDQLETQALRHRAGRDARGRWICISGRD